MSNKNLTLEELFKILKEKIDSKEEGSYTASLAAKGLERISRKVGEEAVEVVVASFMQKQEGSAKTREDLIGEICDLFYHILVLMAYQKIEFSEILEELTIRNYNKK
jgi:phosphoribosyl-ATP pyrophosphohydrolase